MPRDKDLKRIIRARMKKTGESYTTARARVLEKSSASATPEEASAPEPRVAPSREGPAAEGKPAAVPDHAALAGMSDEAVAARTGRTWEEWTQALDEAGAAALLHAEIVRIVHEKLGVEDGWWAQTVTVGYERIKGLRERGQRRGGAWEATRSRTFDVPVAVLFDAWADDSARARWLGEPDARVRTATAPRSMRLQWPDDTLVALWFTDKGGAKSSVQVQHTKLPDKAAAERSKKEWAGRLDDLAALLARRAG